jgi:hypothetical protein
VCLAAIGTDPTFGSSRDRGTGACRVPSLRGVGSRGPLLHDASVPSAAALLDPARLSPSFSQRLHGAGPVRGHVCRCPNPTAATWSPTCKTSDHTDEAMTSPFKLASLAFSATLALTAGCSSTPLNSTGTGGATATGGAIGTGGSPAGGCSGSANHNTAEVPSLHRATAIACAPSTRAPAPPDGGLLSCTRNADCAADGAATIFGTCLHGQCSFDQCLTDADCGATDVCVCANDSYGGNAQYHANFCVPANCRVDSDCGPGGYCSPSPSYCGSYSGYYCHTAADSCIDAIKDCSACTTVGPACIYAPAVGAFMCGSAICAG